MNSAAEAPPYHHGDLRNALIEAAVALAREGGPGAIVLREAARRVGVSPTAAYRHFTSLPDLVDEVAVAGLAGLARSMESELARCRSRRRGVPRALERVHAIGRGYVLFALAEPGLFAVAFDHQIGDADLSRATGDSGLSPRKLLERGLDDLMEAGGLEPRYREGAATAAWAAVHGLSLLLLGPMAAVPPDGREAVIESTLELTARGFLIR
jgi:AcrR family transcriptional regulator